MPTFALKTYVNLKLFIMKKIGLIMLLLAFIAGSCGDGTSKKEETKETKKEKRISKSTQEGMMQLLDECNIKVHSSLEFSEVTRKSDGYKITFIANEVDEAKGEELALWFDGEVEKLLSKGWKKSVIAENSKMGGMLMNEFALIKPRDLKVNTTYGLTFFSSFDKEEKTFKFSVTAD